MDGQNHQSRSWLRLTILPCQSAIDDDKGGCVRPHWPSVAVIGCLLLFCGLAFALIESSWGSSAGVTLSFTGFTNQEIAVGPTPGASQQLIPVTRAVLLAKNTGSVPVELWAAFPQYNVSMNAGSMSLRKGFCPIDGRGLPRVLKPGESMVLTAFAGSGVPWSTEVQYQRRGLLDVFWSRLWNSGVAPLRTFAGRYGSSSFQLVPVRLGPLTNQPSLPIIQAPIPPTYFRESPRWLGPGSPSPKVVNPGYSTDLIDTHSHPPQEL